MGLPALLSAQGSRVVFFSTLPLMQKAVSPSHFGTGRIPLGLLAFPCRENVMLLLFFAA
jgi:hypothetical protein